MKKREIEIYTSPCSRTKLCAGLPTFAPAKQNGKKFEWQKWNRCHPFVLAESAATSFSRLWINTRKLSRDTAFYHPFGKIPLEPIVVSVINLRSMVSIHCNLHRRNNATSSSIFTLISEEINLIALKEGTAKIAIFCFSKGICKTYVEVEMRRKKYLF